MRKVILATIATAALGLVTPAAASVCFNPNASGANPSCVGGTEDMVFLESASNVTTVIGNLGSQTGTPLVNLTSTDTVDASNGFATIKPSMASGASSFFNLNVTVPGQTFTDLDFSAQLTSGDITITALDGSTVEGSVALTGLKSNADLDFLVVSTTPITEVDLTSVGGLEEYKQLTMSGVSGVAVTPLPGALPMFVGGLICLLVTQRRRKASASLLG